MALPFTVDATWVGNVSNPVSLDNGELRRADAAMFAGGDATFGPWGGITRHGDSALAVTVDASDVVTIQPGSVVIPANAQSGLGIYRSALGFSITGNLAARDATNGRIDRVVFQMLDTDILSSNPGFTAKIAIQTGTPSATPSAPALPSMAVELARITVPASGGGAATVDSSYRTYAAAVGGELVVPTSARLPSAAAKYQRARALDTGLEYEWNGSAWVERPSYKRGTTTANTDASGRINVPHGLGVTPAVAFANSSNSNYSVTFAPGSSDATNAQFVVRQVANGNTVNSTSVPLYWVAFK